MYRHEEDAKKEWPLSANAALEDPPADSDAFDVHAKPERFYLTVEGTGALPCKDIVLDGNTTSFD